MPRPLQEKVVKTLIYQILRTLNYLKNKNIVHRDMKMENIVGLTITVGASTLGFGKELFFFYQMLMWRV